jgi:phosphatidate cytidylyltransferase
MTSTRLLAALAGLAIVLPVLVWGGALGLDVLLAIVLVLAADEFAKMTLPSHRPAARALLAMYGLAILGAQLYGTGIAVSGAVAVGLLVVIAWSIFGVQDTNEGGHAASRMALGLLYVPFLFSFVGLLRRFEDGLGWVFLLLVITWFGDTGAYFAGRAFGRTKLIERVSPNKTREGAVGGMLLAVVGACLVKYVALDRVPWVHAVVLGILLDAAGVVGDLFESMLKRTHDVKDSGSLLPGHGGLLDRIDSLLFSAPVAWCYAKAFGLA